MVLQFFRYRIVAAFFLLLISSVSFGASVDMHFCGDELKSLSLFGEAKACDMQKKSADASSKKHSKCCHNKSSKKHSCCHKRKLKKHSKLTINSTLSKKCSAESEDCCHNEQFKIQIDDEAIEDAVDAEHTNVSDKILSNTKCIAFESVIQESILLTEDNPPPLITSFDILAFIQCFRI